jgi:hypothetical protein
MTSRHRLAATTFEPSRGVRISGHPAHDCQRCGKLRRPDPLKASPCDNLAKGAIDATTDRSGLQPWSIFWSARPLHLRFDLANSEISERWNQAHEERGHYRLVLGMPNQNDLLGELKSMQELDQTSLNRDCLDFSPINRRQNSPE